MKPPKNRKAAPAFTPGPWTVETHEGKRRLTQIEIWAGETCCIGTTNNSWPVDVANARLIAAAPDLLAACRCALRQQERYMDGKGGGSDAGLIAVLRDAIQKARQP